MRGGRETGRSRKGSDLSLTQAGGSKARELNHLVERVEWRRRRGYLERGGGGDADADAREEGRLGMNPWAVRSTSRRSDDGGG